MEIHPEMFTPIELSSIGVRFSPVLGQNLDRQNLDRQNLDTDKISTETESRHRQNLDTDNISTRQNLDKTKPRQTKSRHGQNLDTDIYLIKISTTFFFNFLSCTIYMYSLSVSYNIYVSTYDIYV